ncbi:MAG: hypothetical protein AAF993_07555 [Pseudomonadota bacterium]
MKVSKVLKSAKTYHHRLVAASTFGVLVSMSAWSGVSLAQTEQASGEAALAQPVKPTLSADSKATTAAVVASPPISDVNVVTQDDVLSELSLLLATSSVPGPAPAAVDSSLVEDE